MSKTAKVVRTIISVILLALSAYYLYLSVYCGFEATSDKDNGWSALAILVPLSIAIYTSPIFIANLIYQIVMICKKKIFKLELISSIIYFVSWFSPFILLLLFKIFFN